MVKRVDVVKFNQDSLASLTVMDDKDATDFAGDAGKDGVVLLESKSMARKRFWNYFKSKSPEYLNIVSAPETDANIQYILNDKVLDHDFEGKLSAINDTVYKSIKFSLRKI